jgi:hypothetical protein
VHGLRAQLGRGDAMGGGAGLAGAGGPIFGVGGLAAGFPRGGQNGQAAQHGADPGQNQGVRHLPAPCASLGHRAHRGSHAGEVLGQGGRCLGHEGEYNSLTLAMQGGWENFLWAFAREGGLLFLKKKKQKDFIRSRCDAPGPPWGRPGGLAAQL